MNALKVLLRKTSESRNLVAIFHDEGNNFLKQRKYFEALVSYNKSLCHAKPNSVDMVNGFVSRSAVYFETRHYHKCLENIQLARLQSKYQADKIIDERESRCQEFIKLDNKIDIENIFKLSYTSNRRIPHISSCLELGEDSKFGRYIKTNRNLRPGDIVAIETSFFKFFDTQSVNVLKYQRCFNCLNSNKLTLLPGPQSVMSCSQACHDAVKEIDLESETLIQNELDWKILKMIRIKDYSLAITGSVEKLEELFYKTTQTIFDIDFNNSDQIELQENLLKCIASLIGGRNDKVDKNLHIFKLMIGSYNDHQREFLVHFVDHIMNVCRRTQFSLNIYDEIFGQYEKIGNCLLPFGGLLNHSCDPNLFWISTEGKFVYFVAKPIKAGEQLFICYRKTFLAERLVDRQKALLKQYGFTCDCPACQHDYRINTFLDRINIKQYENIHSIREEVKGNWLDIESNFDKESPNKIAEIIARNKYLLEFVASKFM